MTEPLGITPPPVQCKDCGVMVERKYGGRGQKPQRCDECRREHLRQSDRDRHRRITVELREPCPRCGGQVEDRPKRRTTYCAACYKQVRNERSVEAERAAREVRGRRCCDCGAEVPYHGKRTPRRCETCRARRRKSLVVANQWGITSGQYDALFASQGQRCAICHRTEPGKRGWAVDHDHQCCGGNRSCGTCVRGLLCTGCNMLLGFAKDDPEILLRAVDYLRRPLSLKT